MNHMFCAHLKSDTEKNNALVVRVFGVLAPKMKDGSEFDPKVFWSVNGFIFVMLMAMCLFCYFGDKTWITNPEERRRRSDDAYRAALRDRLEQEAQRRLETPEQRTRKLLQSFKRHKVKMVGI